MLKIVICLLSAVVVAAVLLELRQQRMDLAYDCSQLHKRIEQAQIKLWNQQLQIGVYTAPNAIESSIWSHKLDLTPAKPSTEDPKDDPAAEGLGE